MTSSNQYTPGIRRTPTPWKVFARGFTTAILDRNGKEVISWMGFDDSDIALATHRANARLIVKLVNAYTKKKKVKKSNS